MFGGLFGSKEKQISKFEELKEQLSFHEQESNQNLHQNHPHLRGLFGKHNIDLKQIRKKSVKVAAAAAVLGAFLAIPFLIGHPKNIENPPPTGANTTHTTTQPGRTSGKPLDSQKSPGSPKVTHPTPPQPVIGAPLPEENKNGSKGRGHQYGRSFLAPPKEHGLHDLGLHKGEDKSKGKGHEGPHPEELEVRHPEKGENS